MANTIEHLNKAGLGELIALIKSNCNTKVNAAAASAAEAERIATELEGTEQQRINTFNTNEGTSASTDQTSRWGKFNNNEVSRASAENARVVAENARVSAENVRQSNEGSASDTASATGSRWARYKNAENTRQSSFNTNEGENTDTASATGSRWARYKAAEAGRDTKYATAEGTASSPSTEASRWGKYNAQEARRQAAMTTIEAEAAKVLALETAFYGLGLSVINGEVCQTYNV